MEEGGGGEEGTDGKEEGEGEGANDLSIKPWQGCLL